MKIINLLALLCLTAIFISCNGKNDVTEKPVNISEITSPANKTKVKSGSSVNITVSQKDNTKKIDSVQIYIDDQIEKTLTSSPFSYQWTSGKIGAKKISTASYSNSNRENKSVYVEITSDIVPTVLKSSVIKTYPHNKESFTEGLFYDGKFLYESTGLNGKSAILKVQLETGNILKSAKLDNQYFGEGITMLNGKIFQLTWQSKIGFTYDAESFQKTGEFHYDTEGWGMTNNGKELIMTDGTNIISFLDAVSQKVLYKLPVYDDKGPFNNLNEIEYVNGEIYANVWRTDVILIIDAQTGKIKSLIDLSELAVGESKKNSNVDVLNGIAWNAKNGTLLVTGKFWQNIYEIKINRPNA